MGNTYWRGACGCGGRTSTCGFAEYKHQHGKRHIAWLRAKGDARSMAAADRYEADNADQAQWRARWTPRRSA